MSGYVPNQTRAARDAELRQVALRNPHQERWAEYERHAAQPKAPPAKIQVALRIGVFFDGTGNNATNTALGERCGAQHPIRPEDLDASCKPYMADPDSSYGNDVTNIRKLSDLYYAPIRAEGEGQHRHGYRKIYVEGIGTRGGEADSLLGSALGRGDTGVLGCINRAFVQMAAVIQRFHADNSDCEVSSLVFDVFGFSRGAAAARHFANELVIGGAGRLGEAVRSAPLAFARAFHGRFDHDVRVGFIGLFDTVASVGGVTNLGNVRSGSSPGLNLFLSPARFRNVVHLIARDEYRANFPLSSVAPEHLEITVPGAHSDVGGGYLPEAEERILVSPMQSLDVPLGVQLRDTSIYRDALRERELMVDAGWPIEMLSIVSPAAVAIDNRPGERLEPPRKRIYAALELKRTVRGELSRVYLRLMHQLATRAGARFGEIDNRNPSYRLPADLEQLWVKLSGADYSMSPSEARHLLTTYIHRSGNWNPPARLQGGRSRTSLSIFFVNAPNASNERVIYPHSANARGTP